MANMSEVPLGPNVYAVETEYSATIAMSDGETRELVGACHSADVPLELYEVTESDAAGVIAREAFDMALLELGLFRNGAGMLSNGGRLYEDASGYEYATPEASSAEEAVHRMYDGDEIIFRTLRTLQKEEIISSFQLNRRIVDHNRMSRGIHINTATSLEPLQVDDFVVGALSALNVAKGAMFGSGGLLLDERGHTHFHHSPRLSLTNHDSIGTASWMDRPLVRHPFNQDIGCYRVESITADALNFAWPMRASMVMTNALMKLLEIRKYNKELPLLRNPVRAAQVVGRHGHNATISVFDEYGFMGYRPAELLQDIATIALEADVEFEFLDDESDQVLGEVIDVADRLRSGPAEVMKQVESIARFESMKRKVETENLSWDSEKMCKYDYYWDKIGGGIAESMRQKKGWGWLGFDKSYSQRETIRRLAVPPADTRAWMRGKLIKDSLGVNESDWSSIHIGELIYAVPPLSTTLQNRIPIRHHNKSD